MQQRHWRWVTGMVDPHMPLLAEIRAIRARFGADDLNERRTLRCPLSLGLTSLLLAHDQRTVRTGDEHSRLDPHARLVHLVNVPPDSDGLRAASTYIPQVACRLMPSSPESARWTSVSAPSGVCVRANGRSRVDQVSKPQHPGPAAPFFSAADGPVLPLSFSLGQFDAAQEGCQVVGQRVQLQPHLVVVELPA